MKKLIIGLMLFTGVFGLTLKASAEQTINGEGTATIPVQGTLGADNTDENGGIDEGNTNWVNVTVPSKTLFYSKPGENSILAPTYTITNNSGRPVAITADEFSLNGTGTIAADTNLSVNLASTLDGATTNTTIIESGLAKGNLSSASLGTLGNNAGKLTSAGATAPNLLTFTYTGTLDASKVLAPQVSNYDLTLKFSVPVNW